MSGLRCQNCQALFISASTLKADTPCSLCGSVGREAAGAVLTELCHAIDCITDVPAGNFFCLWHWRYVPLDLQTAIWSAAARTELHWRRTLLETIAIAFVACRENKWTREQMSARVLHRASALQAAGFIDSRDIDYTMLVMNRGQQRAAC